VGLDNKYRPTRYEDVAGQEVVKTILRHLVAGGSGHLQSYLFGGPWGSGKTTLARILARALLCARPVGGDPCDACESCIAMLSDHGSPDFVEVDAATRSGKADVMMLLEDLRFDEHAGRRRIYLFDECHRLSPEAEDALLKPMEDCRPGTREKRLVVLFCTTEPDEVRPTILSRCAPPFRVRSPGYRAIASRLAYICETEEIPFDAAALDLVARATGGHFRDAIKAIEATAASGRVSREAIASYLGSDVGEDLAGLLLNLHDLSGMGRRVDALIEKISPSTAYRYLADFCVAAFQVHAGGEVQEGAWEEVTLRRVAPLGLTLLTLADRFGSRPSKVSRATLYCDLALGTQTEDRRPAARLTSSPSSPQPSSPPPSSSAPAASRGVNNGWVHYHPHADRATLAATVDPVAGWTAAQFAARVRDRVRDMRAAQLR